VVGSVRQWTSRCRARHPPSIRAATQPARGTACRVVVTVSTTGALRAPHLRAVGVDLAHLGVPVTSTVAGRADVYPRAETRGRSPGRIVSAWYTSGVVSAMGAVSFSK
jgi:hypothetical protein